jgi:TIR domain
VANVYLTYSRLDEERVAPLAERLTSLGYNVQRCVGADAAEIEAADAIIAVWSRNARHSLRVRAEAAHAADRGALLQMRIDSSNLPAPFHELAVTDMAGDAPEWGALENALSQLVKTPPPPTAVKRGGVGDAGGSMLVLALLALGFAALAATLAPSVQGLLSPDQLTLVAVGVGVVAGASALASVWRLFVALRAGS